MLTRWMTQLLAVLMTIVIVGQSLAPAYALPCSETTPTTNTSISASATNSTEQLAEPHIAPDNLDQHETEQDCCDNDCCDSNCNCISGSCSAATYLFNNDQTYCSTLAYKASYITAVKPLTSHPQSLFRPPIWA